MTSQPINQKEKFHNLILRWRSLNGRNFPWRNTENPFHILISEICLQKTGAEKAEPAYKSIIKAYPTPYLLERAEPEKLLQVFKPLGLTGRAGLLIQIAKQINQEFSGEVPQTYGKLVSIRGVGQYIANAILVFAFGQRAALIDEGIARVYRRVYGIERRNRAYADKALWVFASEMLPYESVCEYNWGLLDISALLCKPWRPDCKNCPLKTVCLFAKTDLLDALTYFIAI